MSHRVQSDEALAAAGVNPASEEARELRETGCSPLTHTDEKELAGGEMKSQEKELAGIGAEAPPAPAATAGVEVGPGEEAAGFVHLAAQRASEAAVASKAAVVNVAATTATKTKETVQKYGTAAVMDAEHLYEASKERAVGWVVGGKAAVTGAVQRVEVATGQVLKSSRDKLMAVAKSEEDGGGGEGGSGESEGGGAEP